MANSVLVTGLGVGYELGVCSACNSDFTWLIDNPSILIWADKIHITPKIWEVLNKIDEKNSKYKYNKAVKLIMQIAHDRGIVEIIDPKSIYDESYGDILYQQAKEDQHKLINLHDHIKAGDAGVPGEMYINDMHYCTPNIASMYASLAIAEHLDANCLFGKQEMSYLNHKFGLQFSNIANAQYNNAFSEVFSLVLPDQLVLHNYAFMSEGDCKKCKNEMECNDTYLKDIEDATMKMMKWREYDSIYQARNLIDNLATKKGDIVTDNDVKEVINMFDERVRLINRNINMRFPKIKRWTNIATMVSVPVALVTLATGNFELSMISGGITGASQVVDQAMKLYRNKTNWVGFINR